MVDSNYIVELRRELHQIPEIGFDLPETCAVVKRELTALGIEFTEKYGKCSVVADIGQGNDCIALRADMDALKVTETTGLPFSSKHEGKMHGCGHDAHTAMLLGVAKALKENESKLNVKVRLIFQPSEELADSGAALLIKNGVLDGVSLILAQHVDGQLDSGKIGICPGPCMTSSHNYKLEFFGKSAHASQPLMGEDALLAAVTAYNGFQGMTAREVDPFENYVFCVGALQGGTIQNVIADYAKILLTVRTYNMELDNFFYRRINEICHSATIGKNISYKCKDSIKAYVLHNDEIICKKLLQTAVTVVGQDNAVIIPPQMCSEDFSLYLQKVKGVIFRLGTRNKQKGIISSLHNSDFNIDEDALKFGSELMLKFVLNIK